MEFEFAFTAENKNQIKVLGVGGGGGNAINNMFLKGISGVDFVICNTDKQALDKSPIPTKILLGKNVTNGLGCGADPSKGEKAALESLDDLKEYLKQGTEVCFVTAGMGGGTGTGAAPVIAALAKEMGILTIGIVTLPFEFEGPWKKQIAEAGLEKMSQSVDTLIVINNQNLIAVAEKKMKAKDAYVLADLVLYNAAKGISDIISKDGYVNVDIADVKTIMKNGGIAIMGHASFSGENRAIQAIEEALSSPLLDNVDVNGAESVLVNIYADEDSLELDEVSIINNFILKSCGSQTKLIFGQAFDETMGETLSVTVIVTGLGKNKKVSEEKKSLLDLNPKTQTNPYLSIPETNKKPENEKYLEFLSKLQNQQNTEKEVFELRNDSKKEVVEEVKVNVKENLILAVLEEDEEVKETTPKPMSTEERNAKLENSKPISHYNSESLKEFSDIPAYLRRGFNIDEADEASSKKKFSRLSLDEINDKKFHIRDNNPFLFDQVD